MASYTEKQYTKQELEADIERLGKEILKAYKRYNPDGKYLSLCIIEKNLEAHNQWWSKDKEHPVKMEGRYVG